MRTESGFREGRRRRSNQLDKLEEARTRPPSVGGGRGRPTCDAGQSGQLGTFLCTGCPCSVGRFNFNVIKEISLCHFFRAGSFLTVLLQITLYERRKFSPHIFVFSNWYIFVPWLSCGCLFLVPHGLYLLPDRPT